MKVFAWCDSPQAPTGFGKSAEHVLGALHGAGYDIVQLAVNQDPALVRDLPWKVYMPIDRANDPYGLSVLPELLQRERPDMMWATFDPEVPWRYAVPGTNGPNGPVSAIDVVQSMRLENPGFRMLGWFPVDGGPLSNMELAMLGLQPHFDVVATMSPHVHELIAWTLQLRGQKPDRKAIEERVHVIPHAVDTDILRVPDREEKLAARRHLGIPEDAFVILQLERNQQRKQNYLGLEVMETLLAKHPRMRGKVLLYQHMLRDEENVGCKLGYNLPELAWRYGLQEGRDVRWPQGFVPVGEMPLVYQMADVFLSTSAGEGFQYPAWEALACGLPLVVPDNSARSAWFKHAPNAQLYGCDDRRLVIRGSYHRRMGMPNPTDAAAKIGRLLTKGVKRKQVLAGAEWVKQNAALPAIQQRWLSLFEEQVRGLTQERMQMQIVVPGDVRPNTVTAVMEHGPGLGDLVLAMPALDALKSRCAAEGKRLHVRAPASHVAILQMANCAHAFETKPTKPGVGFEIRIDDLYRNGHRDGWGDPTTHRTEVIAQHLGVPIEDLAACFITVPKNVSDMVRGRFVEAFGVDPASCVGVALESANPQRALPKSYTKTLGAGIRSMGLTPVLLGRTPLGVRDVGTIDLTGQTDLQYLIALIEMLSAVIAADSAPLHFAGAVGTPLVGCFTLFNPETRLRYYVGQKVAVTPPPDKLIDGERFPAGPSSKARPGLWAAEIKTRDILAALRGLLDIEDAGPKIIAPGDVHRSL